MTKKYHQKTEKSHICHKILAYLAEHPDARDTIEGIVEWWLLKQEIKHRADTVKEALEELVDKGLVLELQGKNTHTSYQLNQQVYEKIKSLVTRTKSGKK